MGRVSTSCNECRGPMLVSRKHLEKTNLIRCNSCFALVALASDERATLLVQARQVRRSKLFSA